MINVGRTSNQDERCIRTRRWHERQNVLGCDQSKGPDPSRLELAKHQIAVEFLLLCEGAKFL
jgi:hypothetical protein